MITGGLGFIGSNLAHRLVALGADVLLVDSLIPDYGGNLFNIDGIADRVHVNIADVRQSSTMNYLVRDREVIFNLAGQVSHIDSLRDPHTDLDINCRSQLTLLEACRHNNPAAKVVYAGTRQVYGRPDFLPVTEQHLVKPTDVNGINKVAGEYYHLVYNNVFGVRACSLRLTNVYGPRQLIKHNRQGFIGWFIRQAIEGAEIQIFGDGTQLRDFVFVDDAVDAFLRAGASDACNGEVFNVGGGPPISHRDLVTMLLDQAGHGSMVLCRLAGGQEGHRHRQLLRLVGQAHGGDRLAPDHRLADGLAARSPSTARTSTTTSRAMRRSRSARLRVDADSVHGPRPGRGPTGGRSGHPPRDRSRLVRAGPGSRGLRSGVRRGVRRPARRRRQHRHRRADAVAARARHRAGRRSDHDAADGGLHGARDSHGGRHAGVCRHRPGSMHARAARGRGGHHVTHPRDHAGAPLRAGGRHDRPRGDCHTPRPGHRRGLRAGAPGDLATAGRSAPSARPARSASTRRRTSARSATAAPSSHATPHWRLACGGCATAARATATTTSRRA